MQEGGEEGGARLVGSEEDECGRTAQERDVAPPRDAQWVGRSRGAWATRTNNVGPKKGGAASSLGLGMKPEPNQFRKGWGKKNFGAVSQLSNVDESVFGRDIDGSNQAVSLKDHSEFGGGAGKVLPAPVEIDMSSGRKNFGRRGDQLSTADEAIFGRDLDASSQVAELTSRGM